MNKKTAFLFSFPILLFLSSCASSSDLVGGKVPSYSVKMNMEDKSGKFLVIREGGMAKSGKSVVSKYRVYNVEGSDQKVLEQSIAFSTPGIFKKTIKLLRPDRSQYKVWFDGKLYQSETSIDKKNKSLQISMKSPESQWNGTKSVPFPGGNGVFCYFTQIVECIGYTGFFAKAKKVKAGKMSFHVIWDGYPFIQEQYLNIKQSPFSSATIEYDGQTDTGDFRFSMSVSGNVIFYLFNDKNEYAKIFWPAQGYSLYHK